MREAGLDHRLGDGAEAGGGRVEGFVDMEVGGKAAVRRQPEEGAEPGGKIGERIGDHAEDAASLGDQVGGAAIGAVGLDQFGTDEAGGLQRDPPLPFGADLAEHRPADVVLRRDRVEMGADRRGAVGIGGAQREAHPGAHVGGGPVRGPVGGDGVERAHEGAVGVRRPAPDMALVEMGVHVGEGGQQDRAAHVHRHRLRRADPAADHRDLGAHEVAGLPEKAGGNRDIGQREVAAGQRAEIHHLSCVRALSCHFLSRRWDSSDRAANRNTPIAAISASAANIRAMFSR